MFTGTGAMAIPDAADDVTVATVVPVVSILVII